MNNNYRIEFFGGPWDGNVIYQYDKPKGKYELAVDQEGEVAIYVYCIKWDNDSQATYIFEGMRVVDKW